MANNYPNYHRSDAWARGFFNVEAVLVSLELEGNLVSASSCSSSASSVSNEGGLTRDLPAIEDGRNISWGPPADPGVSPTLLPLEPWR